MSEELLIEYCSPTLAGIKTGNLFSCEYESVSHIKNNVYHLNKILCSKGVNVVLMNFHNNRALIYVFRPKKLYRDMKNIQTRKLLTDMGYDCGNIYECIKLLSERLHISEDFPHEIGLFLGYPPEDVAGFIKNHGNHSKYTGYWKVYSNEKDAIKKFDDYKKCRDTYSDRWKKGESLQLLTVVI